LLWFEEPGKVIDDTFRFGFLFYFFYYFFLPWQPTFQIGCPSIEPDFDPNENGD
jgi:hypothetical protein